MACNLYEIDTISNMKETIGFGQFGYHRRGYRHRGQDYIMTKGTKVNSLFNGVVKGIIYDTKWHGTRIEIMTALKYIDENNPNKFYCRYCHLFEVKYKNKLGINHPVSFVSNNQCIALSGNSGYCLTYDKNFKSWRTLTNEEKRDIKFKGGSHLHLEIYLKNEDEKSRYTLNDMKKILPKFNCDIDCFAGTTIEGQSAIFIRPSKMCEYLKIKGA